MIRVLSPLVLFTFVFPAVAQLPQAPTPSTSNDPPPVYTLTASSRTETGIPMFGAIGNTRCDSAGNMMFDAGSLYRDTGPYLSVSADGEEHVTYTLPAEVTNSDGDNAWALTPDGTLYVLRAAHEKNKLVEFSKGGGVEDISTLALPARVSIQKIAVTSDGHLFAIGYHDIEPYGGKPNAGFAAVYGVDGAMIRDLSDTAQPVDLQANSRKMPEGDVIAGDDGRFYVLDAKTVRVFSTAGEEVADLKISKPSPNSSAEQIYESHGLLSVIFYTPVQPDRGLASVIRPGALLLYAQTGEIRGRYTFDPPADGSMLCYSAGSGYTSLSVKDKRIVLNRVPIK